MSGVVTSGFAGVVLAWVIYAVAGLFLSAPVALAMGAGAGVLSVLVLSDTIVIRGFVALMGPIGVVLPLLALRHMGAGWGMPVQSFGVAELLVFVALYVGFLAASMGVLPVDLYRLGYAPVPVAVMVLLICVYGALTGNLFIALVAVAGQALWVLGWGSSNWFDHVLHAVLVPAAIAVLLLRLV